MRLVRSRFPWLRLPIAMVVALGLLLQVTVPQASAFAGPVDPLFALGSICHAGGDEPDGAPQPATKHQHEHCALCQLGAVVFLPPEPGSALWQPFVAVASVMRLPAPVPTGTIRLAYASRAPPLFG
ncbi:DUF2946 family protein [Limobrevibacterium gyesilva]|uniref:DUF2946 family protein n=1 Tax=Limobrevibacterium gyesilva TaxID=2991712 RepID=A0AA41YK54_9PROT|nr:DUF2946 family protein [Limobrevibacterium gyesilva]MCW3473632.1 DUF2946 family protein [Limobrevibacterium gyesilva]